MFFKNSVNSFRSFIIEIRNTSGTNHYIHLNKKKKIFSCFIIKHVKSYHTVNYYANLLVNAYCGDLRKFIYPKRCFSKRLLAFLDLMVEEGCIVNAYQVEADKSVIVFIAVCDAPGFIKKYSKPSLPVYYSVKGLNKLIRRSKVDSIYIVHTNLGLLSAKTAIKFNIGGLLLCQIY